MATDVFAAPSRQGLPPGPTGAFYRVDDVRTHAPNSAGTATQALGWANLAIGVLSLTGPAVTGTPDRVVNRHRGRLLGLATINPAHALLHLGFGLWSLSAARDRERSRRYLLTTAGVFGALTGMTTVKLLRRPGRNPTVSLMGMPVDRNGTLVHLTWTAIAAASAGRG